MVTFNCMVILAQYLQIGGGDPYMNPERKFPAYFNGGAVFTPRLIEDSNGPSIAWDCCFSVEGGSADLPLKRCMANHGTYAAYRGGRSVLIRPLAEGELEIAEQKIASWLTAG